jgi:anti-sigma-K factor RsiG
MAVEENDVTALSDEALEQLLVQLQAEEEEVSRRRRKLHDRLASFPNEVTQQQEREISAQRRALHVRIDALRAERSRRRENTAQE